MPMRWWLKIRKRRALDRDLRDEIAFHRDMRVADAGYRDAPPFGNETHIQEEIRDMWTFVSIETAWRDTCYALRGLRRQPAFTSIAILTLAIGIGANAAIFSVVNGVLIKPLPYPRSDELIGIWHSAQFQDFTSHHVNLSSTMYLTYRDRNQTFRDFGVWHSVAASVTGIGEPEEVRTLVVTYGALPALDIPPLMGRWFTQADDTPVTRETAILSYGYWQRRFGGDPAAIGRTITVDSRPRQVIGVMPRGFLFLDTDPEVILPQRFAGDQLRPNDTHAYSGIARLKPGVTLAQANADVARMLPIWIAEYGTDRKVLEAARFAPALRPLKQDVVGDVAELLWVLMGTIGVVLLIACANVANLLLVRAEGRQQELAVRTALGAGCSRIVRGLLLESVLLALMGGAVGLAVAYGALQTLRATGPANLPRLAEITIDPLVLAFTLAVSLFTGLLFGLVPAVKYARRGISVALTSSGRAVSLSRERHRSQSILVVAQVALALILLVAAGLMIRTFRAMRGVAPGFTHPERVLSVRIAIPESQVQRDELVIRMQNDILSRIAAIPGVTSAAFASSLPMETEFENNVTLTAENRTPEQGIPPLRRTRYVSPDFFQTLGTALIAGRDFRWTDIYAMRSVAIVSENLARETWGTPAAALGKRVRIGRVGPWTEIIGVVGDVYDSGVDQQAPPTVYFRAGVYGPIPGIAAGYVPRAVTFAIRGDRVGDESFLQQLRTAVASINPALPLASVRTLQSVYDRSLARTSFTLVMLALAGAMALLLGTIGIYGVISYAVSQRTREIGIRLALGARAGELKRMFVRGALVMVGSGVATGLVAVAGLTRLMKSLLFGISPLDPLTYALVLAVLIAAAVLASYVPARRISRVNPNEALRME